MIVFANMTANAIVRMTKEEQAHQQGHLFGVKEIQKHIKRTLWFQTLLGMEGLKKCHAIFVVANKAFMRTMKITQGRLMSSGFVQNTTIVIMQRKRDNDR